MSLALLPFGPGCPWYSMFEKFGPGNVKWCETTVCTIFNEPANALSNIAYLIGAAYLFRIGMRRYGYAMVSIGITSLIWHSTNNFMTQLFDFIGMFVWGFLLLNWNLQRLGVVSRKNRHWSYLTMNVTWLAALFAFRAARLPYQALVPLIGLGVAGTEIALRKVDEGVRKDYRPLYWTLASLAVAATFSELDHGRYMCDPENHWIQGHALWHVFSALGITLNGVFYRQIPLCRG